ncbi:MAG: PaRep2b protein [Pyrobaculum sp.]
MRNRSAAYFQPKAVVAVLGLVKSVLERLMGALLKEGKNRLCADHLEAMRRYRRLKDAVDSWLKGRPAS